MGELVRFPQERCSWPDPAVYSEPAVIIILPVVRIERAIEQCGAIRLDAEGIRIVSDATDRAVQAFFDQLRNL